MHRHLAISTTLGESVQLFVPRGPMKKASRYRYLEAFVISYGRCERIRTFDPLHPMQVRYQAAPHTESASDYNRSLSG
jgi:hypothetical protein